MPNHRTRFLVVVQFDLRGAVLGAFVHCRQFPGSGFFSIPMIHPMGATSMATFRKPCFARDRHSASGQVVDTLRSRLRLRDSRLAALRAKCYRVEAL
jgi:hypothetical protein